MLERLLHSRAASDVLGVVLFSEGLHLREIARRANRSPPETQRELGILVGIGALNSEKRGNQVVFHQNLECPFLHDLKNLYLKTDGVFFELRHGLSQLNGVQCAFVFGSFARGKEKPGSDIDLLVVGDVHEEEISKKIFEIQRKTGLPINLILWTERDFREKARKGSAFLRNIAKGKKIWLAGDEHEFVRTSEEGAGKKG